MTADSRTLKAMSPDWEYLSTQDAHDPVSLTRHMNNWAAQGWELLAVTFAIKGESGTHSFFWRRSLAPAQAEESDTWHDVDQPT